MDLTSIPNNVSGDGRVFVKQLKKYLGVVIDDLANGDLFVVPDETDTSSYCQPLGFVNLTQTQQAGVNNIKVSWDKSSVYGFKEATVFYRKVTSNSFIVAGTSESNEYLIEDVAVGRYGVKVVPSNIDGGYDKNPKEFFIDVVSSMVTPNPPEQFVVTFDSGEGHWSWKYEGVYDYFELRTDTNVGVTSEFLLARTTDKHVVKEPNIAHGTAYLYVRNSFGVYSSPAVHGFDITDLGIPPKPTLGKGYNGVNIHMDDKGDNDCYVVQIEETVYDNVTDNPFYVERTRGAMRVRYCYKKDGVNKAWSNWAIFNISTLVGTEDIADGAVTVDKMSVGEGAFGKIFAGNIDIAGNLAIVGGAVTLNENGLRCTNNIGDSVVFDDNGMRFVDMNGNEFSAIKRIAMGEAEHGQTVTFSKPFVGSPKIVCNPKEIQVGESNYSQSNVFLVCQPVNVSPTGFQMQCFTQLGAGSSNTQNLGASIDNTMTNYVGEINFYGHSGMFTYYTEYEYTPISGASEVSFNITATTMAGSYPSKGNHACGGVEIYVDGTQYWNSGAIGYSKASVGDENNGPRITTTVTSSSIRITDSSVVKIRLYKSFYRGDTRNRTIATYVINWAKTNANEPTIISTGTASFIAIDTGEYYSVE